MSFEGAAGEKINIEQRVIQINNSFIIRLNYDRRCYNTIDRNVSFIDIVCDMFFRVLISMFSGLMISLDDRGSLLCKVKV